MSANAPQSAEIGHLQDSKFGSLLTCVSILKNEQVNGRELFSHLAAAYFLTLIDGAQTWVENLVTSPDPERLAKILQFFGNARTELHRRLHQHGIEHKVHTMAMIHD